MTATLQKKLCETHGEQLVIHTRIDGNTLEGLVVHETLACGCTVETVNGESKDPKKPYDGIAIGDAVLYQEALYRVEDYVGDDLLLANVHGQCRAQPLKVVHLGEDTLSGMEGLDEHVEVGCIVRHQAFGRTGKVISLGPNTAEVQVNVGDKIKKYRWYYDELVVVRPPVSSASPYFPNQTVDEVRDWQRRERQRRDRQRVVDSSRPMYESPRRVEDWPPPFPPRVKKRDPHTITTADLIQDEVSDLEKKQREIDSERKPAPPREERKSEEQDPIEPIEKRKGTW